VELQHQAQLFAQLLCCSERVWMVIGCGW